MKRLIAVLLAASALQAFAGADAGAAQPGEKTVAATNALRRVHVFVSGKVQGVGFRNFVQAKAQALNLTGWVRNLADKRVELVAEGPGAGIDELLKAVGRGSAMAKVDKVEVAEKPHKGEFKAFERHADSDE